MKEGSIRGSIVKLGRIIVKEKSTSSPEKKSGSVSIIKWLDLHFEETILIVFLVAISCVELMQVVALSLIHISEPTRPY